MKSSNQNMIEGKRKKHRKNQAFNEMLRTLQAIQDFFVSNPGNPLSPDASIFDDDETVLDHINLAIAHAKESN